MLWDFEPTSFISHCFIDDPLAKYAQVLLLGSASDISQLGNKSWLLNLDQNIPDHASSFSRILEIVSDQEKDVLHARRRWQQYKEMGFSVKGHKL